MALSTDGQMDGRTDGQTDGRTEWNQYTPLKLHFTGGIITFENTKISQRGMIFKFTIIQQF